MVFREFFTLANLGRFVKKQVKREKGIIYGGQAIKQQIGLFARPTNDYDVLSRQPKKSARKLAQTLNHSTGKPLFYSAPSTKHKGTFKVKHVGQDRKRNTSDDFGVADFTYPQGRVKTVRINGIRYASLSTSILDKRKSLADAAFKFRHEKDREDINRIKTAREVKRFARRR